MIIGLAGVARSGKDTVAGFLVNEGFIQISPADKVREFALAADPYVVACDCGCDDYARLSDLVADLGWEGAKELIDVRRLLQRVGTEAGRHILGEDVWLDATMRDLDRNLDYVFSSVRFPNEAAAITVADENFPEAEQMYGEVWRIERKGYEPINNHASDTPLDKVWIDRTLFNDWTLEDLQRVTKTQLRRARERSRDLGF